MANGRSQIDLGFAEFAAQLVAELHEAVLAAQAGQDDRRTELASLATMRAEQFARRYITDDEIDSELARLFPGRGAKGHRIRAGLRYAAVTARKPEAPPIQTRLGIRLGRPDLRSRSGRRVELTAAGVKTIRDAVRLRLSEARLRPLRQMATQGMPRVVVDSGHVNVKLNFRLVDLDKMGVRNGKDAAVVSLKPLAGMTSAGKDGSPLRRLRLVVRQVNNQTTPSPPTTAASGIGELELIFKTV
jgi:hypothetical protein